MIICMEGQARAYTALPVSDIISPIHTSVYTTVWRHYIEYMLIHTYVYETERDKTGKA